MNFQIAYDIFLNCKLVFGNPIHIQARDELRKAARSRKHYYAQSLKELNTGIRYKYRSL